MRTVLVVVEAVVVAEEEQEEEGGEEEQEPPGDMGKLVVGVDGSTRAVSNLLSRKEIEDLVLKQSRAKR